MFCVHNFGQKMKLASGTFDGYAISFSPKEVTTM